MKFSTGKFPFSCTHEKTFLVGFSRKKKQAKKQRGKENKQNKTKKIQSQQC